MIIRKLFLKNIRSYTEQEIEFPEGSILLSGDIGSGKTSILLALEFALFGLQPGQKGTILLRNGENEALVKLEFEIDGEKFEVVRGLKRGSKSITQEKGTIKINNEKLELSPTELKNKILEILAYPQEFSKKQNILYKFTVYTPQEEMKQIILEEPEVRINTIRNIFGIDKYKKILENVSIITSKIREEKRIRETLIENLEQEKIEIISKEEELESKYNNLSSLERELFLITEERKRIQEEKEEISTKIEEKNKLTHEIEKTKFIISNKKDSIQSNLKLIENLENQLKEISKIKFDEKQILELEKIILSKKNEKEEINNKILSISSEINSLKIKNKENEEIKKKISKIEICPTCLQNVDPVYKSNVINKIDSDSVENSKRIRSLEEEKEKISLRVNALNEEIIKLERNLQDLRILKIKIQESKEKEIRIEELRKNNASLEKDIQILNDHLDLVNRRILEMKKYEVIFEEKKKELEETLKKERATEIKIAELKKEIDMFSRQLEELKNKIKKGEEIREKIEYMEKIENWLSNNFSSLINTIEKNVMIKLKSEFSKFFSNWFSMLVSDNFEVRIDEDFTPIIEYQGYELSYDNLSGGERTAIALAYRLALNQVINSMLSKIKTKDLIILDEPTDGFSEQQLDKMRDVLRELNVKQLIIVSHEQKIESFVENVIRFKKEHGISTISSKDLISLS
ncbi:MAG: hypothetical protein KatS3mg001_493 [Candidatus Pacearchaeota archaeon]|nr:MAG: hypothetical protein KatS3mg001_493 [Candidatus Pacearchaeota archaeon]